MGTLSRNRFWDEKAQKRTAHATTTLIRDENELILVDPSLPAQLLTHFLDERSGLTPDQITTVFLTNFRPVHRRSLALFENARWLMHQPEITAMEQHLEEMELKVSESDEGQQVDQLISDEQKLLERIQPAEEKITPQVHLFPLKGITPGSAGLLLAFPSRTIMIVGDAIVNREYYEAGQVYEQVADANEARESFMEVLEVADEIVPGHDNLFSVVGR
jgi:glyoxylase-like metal-dependent hydrolase (beta-lactamase superfamily II)